MDFCIVGLLLLLPRSSYGLRQAFSETLSLFYSSSLGSLQLTLKKLQALGYVQLSHQQAGGRRKKTWQASAAGQAWFVKTMFDSIPASRLEETALARLHFLGLLPDSADRVTVLALIVATIEKALAGLEQMQSQYSQVFIPQEYRDMASYQLATLDYGVQSHRQALEWFRQRLDAEKQRPA
ncbi:MAG: PadR family transcriptional regulator [Spirochaetes bacterium]|nr:PadR family transcriptional regulator [Spirochaetota bacterium]